MPLFDIAVNASNKQLIEDFGGVLERSLQAGVDKWLMVGSDVEHSRQVLQISQADSSGHHLFCTAGVHPHDAKAVSKDFIEDLTALQQHPQVVAVGECGLDFNRDFSPRPQQESVFEQQLALACALNKPIYMHERDAAERFIAIITPFIDRLSKGVVHCFTGDKATLARYLDLGLSIGITGWICDERRGLPLRELMQYIPLDRLMIETDSPFLLPRSLKPKPKSRRNEPAFLPHIAETIADILNISQQQLADATYHNSCHFFGIES
ncbi:MAG: TatD DNase family protein [Phenylobacterium sp.]|jgi:TatD DNase family protein